MRSTRLPGKIFLEVNGKPLLEYLVERLLLVKEASAIVILTSTKEEDDLVARFCKSRNIACIRGPEEDVLARYFIAASIRQPTAIVRITADCPLIDPQIIDEVIRAYKSEADKIDYLSTSIVRSYPRGMDVEIFSFEALKKAQELATASDDREHVTLYMYRHPDQFRIQNKTSCTDLSRYRLTVDTKEDFQLIRHIIEHFCPANSSYTLADIVALLEKKPEWVKINQHILQKPIRNV